MKEADDFLQYLELSIKQINIHKQIALELEVDENVIEIHDELISHFINVQEILKKYELSKNHINQFNTEIQQVLQYFPYRGYEDTSFIQHQDASVLKGNIESQFDALKRQVRLLQFNVDFFKKLGFFNSNIVAIGANGSGKTTLSNKLKQYLPENGVVISAQKVLIIPSFSGISNFNNTNKKLQQTQVKDKSLRVTYSTESNGNSYSILNELGGEFQILLDNLLAERSVMRNQFCDSLNNGGEDSEVPFCRLDRALEIWNSLIQHRVIECNDGINITLTQIDSNIQYPAYQMSDGEKVLLYFIAHILQAPESGFIIVDEPEMYLHKTILTKLWDILEQERQDCIFIYLTHDLDFATSRVIAKKVWIRSFNHPDNWEIKNIPNNEMPEPLLLELLGSRKNILFCEGQKGSIDEKLYNILFKNFTVTPVDDCLSVINYTKAFNKLSNVITKAFGIIDSDHHGIERLRALEPFNILSYSMVEPENLFLDEDFLKVLAKQLLIDEATVEDIKNDVILKLKNEIDLQVSNYITAKINYYFNGSHVSKGNTLIDVNKNYEDFTNKIDIHAWYEERKIELEKIIADNAYSKALSVYNNKGLKAIVNKHFKIQDFLDKAITLLQYNSETHILLSKYFPEAFSN